MKNCKEPHFMFVLSLFLFVQVNIFSQQGFDPNLFQPPGTGTNEVEISRNFSGYYVRQLSYGSADAEDPYDIHGFYWDTESSKLYFYNRNGDLAGSIEIRRSGIHEAGKTYWSIVSINTTTEAQYQEDGIISLFLDELPEESFDIRYYEGSGRLQGSESNVQINCTTVHINVSGSFGQSKAPKFGLMLSGRYIRRDG